MKIAILSDIHSNLEALKTTIAYIESDPQISEIVCLGDIIGYSANPNECVEIIRKNCKYVVLGNHDAAAIGKLSLTEFNLPGRKSMEWTLRQLTDQNKEFLASLPLIITDQHFTFVHSSPKRPENWTYITSLEHAKEAFKSFTTRICIIGHTHVPGIICEDITTLRLSKELRCLINVGSVGQPRDLDPRLCFGVFDSELWSYHQIRLQYDIEATAKKILDAGLHQTLAHRIFHGF